MESQNITDINSEKSQYNTQENAKKENNSNSFKREPIKNTPFNIIYKEGVGYFAIMGNHQITECEDTEKKILDKFKKLDWNIILTVISIITEKLSDRIELEKEYEKLLTKQN